MRINIKPLSVNDCWQGKRFKTPEYKSYEREMLVRLQAMKLPEPPFKVYYIFGVSNMQMDFDNPVKPFQDILQKKYGFNDSHIHKAVITKIKVEKGHEFIEFDIQSL